jgi:hypothetical protein
VAPPPLRRGRGPAARLLAALGLVAGCGSDPAEAPTAAALSLAARPTDGWCCPGQPPLTCPLVAVRLPASPPAGDQATGPAGPISSLTVDVLDTSTGLAVSPVPPGRCGGISGPCGHVAVDVYDGADAPLDLNQHFGFGAFEFSVGESASTTRRVHVELRNDRNEPLLDAAGAPVATDLFLEVVVVDQGEEVAAACLDAPPSN